MMKKMNAVDATYPWSPIERRPECCVPESFILAENLSLFYRDKAAFENVNVSISKGCITALVGPSGCGKTSFLTCLNRMHEMIPQTRVTGSLHVDQKNLMHESLNTLALRRQVGMIFQKPNPFPLSIRKNLTLPLDEHGMKHSPEKNSIVEKVLTEVGLWNEVKDRLDTSALALSGGQQQRLCIARALTLRPEILLMDEPCSALDPISSGVVEDLIASLRGKYTVVVVTHNLAQARRLADFVGFFWVQQGSGRLIEFGPSQQIFEKPQNPLTAAYIGGIRG